MLSGRIAVLVSFDWPRALAWRLRQQLLDPVGTDSVEGVVRRLGAVQAQLDSAADLAIRTGRKGSRSGEVADALAEGRIIKTVAFRGATHLMTPEEGGVYLALRATSRMWELPSWQSFYRLKPADWPALREAAREALADGPRTRPERGVAITARSRFRRNACHRGAYFRAYRPATPDHVHYWLGDGLGAGRKRIQAWIAGLGDRLTAVDIEGETAYVLCEDLDELAASLPTIALRLLPGYDQWVLGPGTADARVVAPARRAIVSRGANIVILGGVVSGTWSLSRDRVAISWFAEGGRPPLPAIEAEVARLAAIVDRDLRPSLQTV